MAAEPYKLQSSYNHITFSFKNFATVSRGLVIPATVEQKYQMALGEGVMASRVRLSRPSGSQFAVCSHYNIPDEKGKRAIDSCRMYSTACLDLPSFIQRSYKVQVTGRQLFPGNLLPNRPRVFLPACCFETNLPEHERPCGTLLAYFPY
jgi:hypothetical protein